MTSSIYLSEKLEKVISNNNTISEKLSDNLFGKWNANVFYIIRQKWLLITHSETKFSIILPNINSSNINRLNEIFINSLYNQLAFEEIEIDINSLSLIIGNIVFHRTDNDRKTIGTQNSILELIKHWDLNNENVREICKRINQTPTKVFKWKNPCEMMYEKIKKVHNKT